MAHRIRFPEATSVCVDAIGSSFDTVLYVRGQFCEFNEDGCNDDLSALSVSQSKLQFDAFANTDYFVFVDGWNLDPNAEGAYQLNIFPGPCNEVPGPCAETGDCPGDCQAPIVIDRPGEWELSTQMQPRPSICRVVLRPLARRPSSNFNWVSAASPAYRRRF